MGVFESINERKTKKKCQAQSLQARLAYLEQQDQKSEEDVLPDEREACEGAWKNYCRMQDEEKQALSAKLQEEGRTLLQMQNSEAKEKVYDYTSYSVVSGNDKPVACDAFSKTHAVLDDIKQRGNMEQL